MVEATNPRKAVQQIKMDYENVSQVSMEVNVGSSGLTTDVTVFIEAARDAKDYVNLLTDLYDAGFDVEDKGKVETGRRMVRGSQ
ncbi:hypothetical protein M199_gp061 [Halogranum tailed virus 1]|uniref:Uncharacterized protein n=1 Tax=Halogranum tailed virus 1 TaxID=1273749 RepID=R4T9J9_9CAUD|nr:hypothetical protein M199_gp061 [Halogranum tailed virus 1]AGM11605.1 hypothetical protein HGTV1_308 [Halogranum tailed virus 1]